MLRAVRVLFFIYDFEILLYIKLMIDFLEFLYIFYKKLSADNIQLLVFLIKFPLCAIGGLIITLSHSFFSYSWLRNNFNIYVGITLPVIGLTITTIIGSNIALSLGMLGALSIVRFRTPIRSAYELILYFSLLTVGIAAKVDVTITILLITTLSIVPFFIIKISNLIKFNKNGHEDKKQIFLNFEGKIKLSDLSNLAKEKNVKTYSVQKKDKDFHTIKVFAAFDNLRDKNDFINKWQNSINSFDVSKEELDVH